LKITGGILGKFDKYFSAIKTSDIFELDIHQNHYAMGHIITPSEIIEVQGWAQMETFIPIKLKATSNL
jgi:hypothetical protein